MPQGPPLPLCTVLKDELHTCARIGYDASGGVFRYPGEYSGDTNFFANGRQSLYGLGDVFIESYLGPKYVFQPSRLWGTFEVGARDALKPGQYCELYLRHRSAHDIDETTLPDDMWEYVGVRYRRTSSNFDAWMSGAYYTRRILVNYATDAQVHGQYRHGMLFGRAVTLDGDVHWVTEQHASRSGFVDFAVQPALWLNKSVSVFAIVGSTHDVDQPDGRSNTPLIAGIKANI